MLQRRDRAESRFTAEHQHPFGTCSTYVKSTYMTATSSLVIGVSERLSQTRRRVAHVFVP